MPDLPPQRRSRSLARLEEEIAQAELACTRWRTQAASLEDAGRDSRQSRGLLGVAEERLAQLNRSREVLQRGEEGGGRRARLTRRGSPHEGRPECVVRVNVPDSRGTPDAALVEIPRRSPPGTIRHGSRRERNPRRPEGDQLMAPLRPFGKKPPFLLPPR